MNLEASEKNDATRVILYDCSSASIALQIVNLHSHSRTANSLRAP